MGFFDTLNDTLQLWKYTFVIIAKNHDIIKPTLAQIWWGVSLISAVILSFILSFFVRFAPVEIVLILIITLGTLFLFFGFPFLRVYYRGAQCWIVYKTFAGEQVTYKDGLERAKKNKGDIFIITVLDVLLTALARKLKNGTGRGGLWIILNIIMWIAGKVVEEGWDLIGHFLLPASIIEDKNVGEVLPEIKNLKNNVPAALAGVFGFDFAGDLLIWYVNILLIFLLIGAVILGIMFMSWIPVVIGIILMVAVDALIKIFVEMLKTIYFTLFYVSITRPMNIAPQYKDDVTHYLLYHNVQQKKNSSKPQESPEQQVNKLIPYIKQYRSQGYSDAEISSFLVKNGWSLDVVNKALEESR